MTSAPFDVGKPPATFIQFVLPGNRSPATQQPYVSHSAFSLYRKMQRQKATPKLQTCSSISNTAEVPASIVDRQSVSAGPDNRLLLLHRKCPNPLVCVGATAENSQPLLPTSVPFVGFSPVLFQPLPSKPRLRPVASHQEAAEIHIVGNGVREPSVDAPLPPCLSAKQKQLRRKVYSSHSADGRSKEKQTGLGDDMQGKARATDIYIPTASSSVLAKPPLGSQKLKDKVDSGMTAIQPNAYYIDVVQKDGRLKMEHVENPRPLPPRHFVSDDYDDTEIPVSSRGNLHSRLDSVSKRRCLTDSELRSSPHLIGEQPSNIARSNSLYASPPIGSIRRMFSGDSEQTFYPVSAGLKQNPNSVGNSRTVCVDDGALRRHSSGGQRALSGGVEKLQRRRVNLKKAISDLGRQILHDDGHSNRREFGPRALPCCESTESCSVDDKYAIFSLLAIVFLGLLLG